MILINRNNNTVTIEGIGRGKIISYQLRGNNRRNALTGIEEMLFNLIVTRRYDPFNAA